MVSGSKTASATWFAACIAAAVAGCVGTPAGERSVVWPPLSPSSLAATRTAQQVLRVAFGDRQATLNCVVAVTPHSITVIGTTAAGMRAFTVKYDGISVQAQNHLPLQSAADLPPPERLLNDLQLVHWPLEALQRQFAGSEWAISEPYRGTRRLERSGRLVAEVHYTDTDAWSGMSWLANLESGYTLGIESKLMGEAR
jgi:hypothetical protein